MFLKRFVFVNWGNIPNLEFELGPVNLFSGGNGSGKTTAADAIQTIMTAAHENLFQYNPGQDETTQRGRGGKRVRTLASYVLGCDDGSYARLDPSDGYLAAIFHPTQGEDAEPFTAVIGIRAWLDTSGSNTAARQDSLNFFILPATELALKHFLREDVGGKYITPLDRIQTLLIKEFGKSKVEKYDTKKAYLRRLYGALRGRRDGVSEAEAVNAARAFSRFMAYKPVHSINRMVAEEILEQKDLGEAIRSVSSQLKTIHNMEREASQLLSSIEVLQQAHNHSQLYIEQWIGLNVLDYTLAQQAFQQRQKEYVGAKQRQREQRQSLKAYEKEIEQTRQRGEQLRDQIVSLEAQRQGVAALRQKDELQKQYRTLEQELITGARELLEEDARLGQNLAQCHVISQLLDSADFEANISSLHERQTVKRAHEMVRQGEAGRIDVAALTQRDLTDDYTQLEQELERTQNLQQLHNRWHEHWHRKNDGQGGLRDELSRHVVQCQNQLEQLSRQRRQKQQEVERLQAQKVTYPTHVERALAAIRQQCPKADPRVLCDHVEVKDPQWQAAIEGYLGGARFSILVEAEHEAEAIRIVRKLGGRDNKARIIQGHKAAMDAERAQIDADSIIQVLDFSHAVARHYLTASYGSVLRVDNAEQLRMTRRGLTTDGMASGNYSMWRCDLEDSLLVFGVAARSRALTAKLTELEEIEHDWHSATKRSDQASKLLSAVDALTQLNYGDRSAAILDRQRELLKVQALLDQIDLGEHQALEEKLVQHKQEDAALRGQETDLNRRIGELHSELVNSERTCKQLSDMQESNRQQVEQNEENLRAIARVWTEFDVDQRLNHADNEAQELQRDVALKERQQIENSLHSHERKMGEALAQHNQHCKPGHAIAYVGFDGRYDSDLFDVICAMQGEIDRVFNILKNNILVEKHGQLSQLKVSFNNAFVDHLCQAIYQALNEGKQQIEQLNRELQHHRFGADRETFRFAQSWIPEFQDYARFFEEVVKNPGMGDEVSLFEAKLSTKSAKVRDELMKMLLDEDEQRAFRELERISDYRNYRRYEIYKEVEGKEPIPLSEYGTGSGGQLETPAYIIRSAAITSAFRFAEGNNHLRMVLVDEAFSKMDETRSREVIDYLTESLGLQLLFIMPTSKCGPYMDLISNEYVFAKVPSSHARGQLATRVLVDRKQCKQERIKELWAKHRRTVYQQAEMDFMQEVLGSGAS